MTPRRPVHRALSLFIGGLAATAVVGCGNGMQVAGPGDPHESVVSGHATPSAGAPESPTATPTPDPSTSPSDRTERNAPKGSDSDDDDSDADSQGSEGSGKGSDGNGDDDSGNGGKDRSGDDGATGSTGPGSDAGDDSKKSDDGSKGKSGDTSDSGNAPTSKQVEKRHKGVTACELDDLSIGARIPEGSGAAGSSYVLITFTNTSGKTCSMYGYAGVSFVGNKDGTQLGKPAAREHSAKPKSIKLSDGEVQTELLRITSAGNFDAAKCVPTTSDGFRVYPPSSYTSAYVKFETDVCQSKSVRQMTVYPVGTKS